MGTRGELRIYLGAAPGVGKTYAMLGEAHRRAERGTDVVVGLVETHGRRQDGRRCSRASRSCPAGRSSYRGVELTELDVDAVLARAPQVVLVDELAHTNAPGSRHAKRWQDVEDLLDAGITVLTTVNIQHLESLNDVIERITGVRQQETVPDEVVRRAQQVELVDITPEALRRRMAHGNVYAPEKVDAAMANYFQPRNLTALREMALLWLADQVEVALQRYRTDQQITDIWETRERVVVALTGGPESETVLRRAARIAERSGSAELFAVHVLRGDGLAGAPVGALAGLRRLAEDVGASFHTVVARRRARRLCSTSPAGSTPPSSSSAPPGGPGPPGCWSRASGRGSSRTPGTSTCTWSPTPRPAAGSGCPAGSAPSRPRRRAAGWALGLLLPLTAVGIGILGARRARAVHRRRAVLPGHRDQRAGRRARPGPARRGRRRAAAQLLPHPAALHLHHRRAGERHHAGGDGAGGGPRRARRRPRRPAGAAGRAGPRRGRAARVVLPHGAHPRRPAAPAAGQDPGGVRPHLGRDPAAPATAGGRCPRAPGRRDCTRPEQADVDVAVEPDTHLVGHGRALAAAERRLLDAVAGQALLALRNQQIAAEAAEARRRADATELRTALLSAVGHDLRTPLASIKAAAGSLRDERLRLSEHDRGELAATVEESADRLTGVVDNLLDSSRLATGAVTPQLQPVGYDEVAPLALRGLDGADRVRLEIDERAPRGPRRPRPARAGGRQRRRQRPAPRPGAAGHAARPAPTRDRVELRIVDTGPGVPRDARPTACSPRSSGSATATRAGSASG